MSSVAPIRKRSAWELENELLVAIEMLEDIPDGDPQAQGAIHELVYEAMEAVAEKRDALAGAYKRKQAQIAALHERANDAEAKALRADAALRRFQAYILGILDMHGEKQISGTQYKIGWQQNPQSVEVDPDFGQVDDEGTDAVENTYIKVAIVRTPDKEAIRKYLKSGGTLVRARLKEGARRIVIR